MSNKKRQCWIAFHQPLGNKWGAKCGTCISIKLAENWLTKNPLTFEGYVAVSPDNLRRPESTMPGPPDYDPMWAAGVSVEHMRKQLAKSERRRHRYPRKDWD